MTNKKGYRDMPELKPTTEALMRADAMIADLTAQNAMLKLQNDAKDIEIANLKGIIESAREEIVMLHKNLSPEEQAMMRAAMDRAFEEERK